MADRFETKRRRSLIKSVHVSCETQQISFASNSVPFVLSNITCDDRPVALKVVHRLQTIQLNTEHKSGRTDYFIDLDFTAHGFVCIAFCFISKITFNARKISGFSFYKNEKMNL